MRESIIVTSIHQYLSILERQGKLVYVRNNSGALQTARGHFMHFGKTGSSDFLIFIDDGKTIHLEVKNEKGRQSVGQKTYQKMVEKLGHQYIIVRSLTEVQDLLK